MVHSAELVVFLSGTRPIPECVREYTTTTSGRQLFGEKRRRNKKVTSKDKLTVKFGTTTKRWREKIGPEKMQRELLGTQSRPTISSSLLFIA
jgi:hypothetical protein